MEFHAKFAEMAVMPLGAMKFDEVILAKAVSGVVGLVIDPSLYVNISEPTPDPPGAVLPSVPSYASLIKFQESASASVHPVFDVEKLPLIT